MCSSIDFDAMPDLLEAVVHLKYGEHRKSFPFTPQESGPYKFEAALTDPKKDEYQYEVEYHFDPELGDGPRQLKSSLLPSRRRMTPPGGAFDSGVIPAAASAAELPAPKCPD